jgi:hypothetical membrane protein
MARYPGGTPLDPTSRGYSLAHNFLSDLGMTVAYNHEPNRLGASLFVSSLLLLVIGMGHVVIVIARSLAVDPASRWWARAAGVFGLLACMAFAGVAVTPENHVMAIHVAFTQWAWRFTPVIAAFLGVASLYAPRVGRRVTFAWFAAAVLLAGYVMFGTWGPQVAMPRGLASQVIAQKAAAVLLIGTLLFVAAEVERPRGSSEDT